ncbi:LacI family DNA-binding transcriptional regulator [Cellulomonas massiliensis]|uniref:LacI family DNA-binding transcriptional regulator n=1 Tax=Cellulomonas massiliensis TaxID=1465811 RepID=UPI0002FB9A5E|nr:LacI family DNA-binding transcriptional regulator [Cellulomonas massiliensis]
MRKRVTLADVASAAGVSPTTASLVLSGRGDELRISRAVQQRVRESAEELSYRPNILSLGLRNGRSSTLGFISDTVATSQLAGDMIKGAIDAANEHGFMLFIGESEGDPAAESRLLNAMHDRQVDGVVLASMFTQTREVPPELAQFRAVLLNAIPAGPTHVPVVVPDEYTAGHAAARLLVDAGHRDIHLIGVGTDDEAVPPRTVAGHERLAGILDALQESGLRPVSGQLCDDWQPPEGRRAVQDLLTRHPRPGALLCFNDRLAFGAYQALERAGLRVPGDVSVVSFDDYPLAAWLEPALTTFAIPHEQLGRYAVELLLEQIQASTEVPADPVVHRLDMPLRLRHSVAPAPGA